MKYKFFGIGLAVFAGALIWQGALTLFPKQVIVSEQRGEGEVSVEVNYLPRKSDAGKAAFEISLDTHSVDLGGIDFQKLTVMQKGKQTFFPVTEEVFGSKHHQSAVLSFPKIGVPLKIVFLGTKEIEKKEFEFIELPATSSYSP